MTGHSMKMEGRYNMDVIVLFWLNSDNFVGIIPDPMCGDAARNRVIREWEKAHDYNPDTIMGIDYYISVKG